MILQQNEARRIVELLNAELVRVQTTIVDPDTSNINALDLAADYNQLVRLRNKFLCAINDIPITIRKEHTNESGTRERESGVCRLQGQEETQRE